MTQIKTKRWDDPVEPDDGARILICRYRPRGVAKHSETWAEWMPELGPSKALHAAAYGKGGTNATWETYRRMYLREMAGQTEAIASLAERVKQGEQITLLCSSSCDRESRCHRSLLREMILERAAMTTTLPFEP